MAMVELVFRLRLAVENKQSDSHQLQLKTEKLLFWAAE